MIGSPPATALYCRAVRGVMDYRGQVRQLQREITELSEEGKDYRKQLSHTAQDKDAQQMREKRLQQLIDELMRLASALSHN